MPSRSVLFTGCSAGGLGAAMALALAKRGHYIFATARNPTKIPDELTRLPNVSVLSLDVLDPSSVAAAVKAVVESGHGLDVLVNNAGAGYAQPILDIDIEKAKEVYDVNVWGPLRTIQAFSALLINSRGKIVNISTVGAIVNTPWISAYASSKAALNLFSDTLRLELSPFAVTILTLMVGAVDSNFHKNDSATSNIDFKLRSDSLYAPVEDIIATWASGDAKPKGCPAEEFAESIVDDIVSSGKGGLLYRGPHAGSVHFMAKWLPTTMRDTFMSTGQGLKELSQHLLQKK